MLSINKLHILDKWHKEINSNEFKFNLLYCLFLGAIIVFVYPIVMDVVENREGYVLNDWVLNLLPPKDFSTPLFILVQLSIWFTLLYHITDPRGFIKVVQVWGTLQVFRMITIYSVPLEPPLGMIPLIDPFVDRFFGNVNYVITKDLFFSGHTSTSFLAILFLNTKKLKLIAIALCATVGLLIMWQHVHYTIDVLAAPFFAYITYLGVYKFDSFIFPKPEEHKTPLP